MADVAESVPGSAYDAARGSVRGPRAARALRRSVVLLAGTLLAMACGDGDRPGTIVGQIYVVLQSGNSAPMDIRPVRLVPESARLDSTLSALCITRDRAVANLGKVADSIIAAHNGAPPPGDTAFARVLSDEATETAKAMQARQEILDRVTLRATHTTKDGSFVFDSVPPGKYRIWSDATLDSGRWNWLYPVKVPSGDSLHVALNNSNADDNPLKCPTPLGE
jgi:hypothetical protein